MFRAGGRATGISAALGSAFFLGLAPVFGKLAILSGFSPLAVVALRTAFAALMLFALIALFQRPLLYIFPLGFWACFLAGVINGSGSILYYAAIQRLGVSVGQLLYSLYPLFVAFWMILDRQFPSRITLIRMTIALVGMILLTISGGEHKYVDPVGMLMMIGASALYALHLPINQRVLLEAPPPTVTLYTLISMSAVVVPAYLIFDRTLPGLAQNPSWLGITGLTLVTFASRLTLFLGIKHLGELQAALLGLTELLVAIIFSHLALGESLSSYQLIGAALLAITLVLVSFDKQPPPRKRMDGWLSWIRPPMPVIPPWDSQHE